MICVQTSCVNPQPDTMAGYTPQNRSRTKAAARYILFLCRCVVFLLLAFSRVRDTMYRPTAMFRFFCFAAPSISCLQIAPQDFPLDSLGLLSGFQFPWMDPSYRTHVFPVTFIF